MTNLWTSEELQVLDGIVAMLIRRGVAEKHARMIAERQLEQRIARNRGR
jgi:hypothetical protein